MAILNEKDDLENYFLLPESLINLTFCKNKKSNKYTIFITVAYIKYIIKII
jgi:hypothetical protein